MGTDVAAVVEGFEPAPDARPLVFDQFWFSTDGAARVVEACAVAGVDPLFHFNRAGAVIQLVGYVGGLGGDVADLTDKCDLIFQWLVDGRGSRELCGEEAERRGYLCYFHIVNREVGVRVGL